MEPQTLESEALAAIRGATTIAELDDARVRYLGRKSELKQALRQVRDRESGMTLNALRQSIEDALEERRVALEDEQRVARAGGNGFDVTLPGEHILRGRLHLLTQIRRQIEDIFLGLGYEVFDSREVETAWYNFDALNQPEAHPSRDPQDTFYVADDVVLRTHTSPGQIRAMQSRTPPVYVVSLGRCYRRDTPDPTHTPTFHQVECLAVDRNISLADLKGTVETFFRTLFGGNREVRMRTSYFPFTEPSVEFDVTCFLCDAQGCNVCGYSGWIEMGGAGEVDPAVFERVGYDPDEWTGFAFGFGIDRIAMLRHGLPDLRLLWDNDIRFLSQF